MSCQTKFRHYESCEHCGNFKRIDIIGCDNLIKDTDEWVRKNGYDRNVMKQIENLLSNCQFCNPKKAKKK